MIKLSNIINTSHPLNRMRFLWWLTLPNLGGGNIIYDITNNKQNGISKNISRIGSSRPGLIGSIYYNGSSSYIATIPIFIPPPADFTIAAWINTNSATTSSGICGWAATVPTNEITDRTIYLTSSYYAQFELYSQSLGPRTITSSKSLNDGNWHRIIGTIFNGIQSLYVDGILIGSLSTPSGYNAYGATAYFISGASQSGYATNYFPGFIDDVSVWNRGLSSTEVLADYYLSQQGYFGVLLKRTVCFSPKYMSLLLSMNLSAGNVESFISQKNNSMISMGGLSKNGNLSNLYLGNLKKSSNSPILYNLNLRDSNSISCSNVQGIKTLRADSILYILNLVLNKGLCTKNIETIGTINNAFEIKNMESLGTIAQLCLKNTQGINSNLNNFCIKNTEILKASINLDTQYCLALISSYLLSVAFCERLLANFKFSETFLNTFGATKGISILNTENLAGKNSIGGQTTENVGGQKNFGGANVKGIGAASSFDVKNIGGDVFKESVSISNVISINNLDNLSIKTLEHIFGTDNFSIRNIEIVSSIGNLSIIDTILNIVINSTKNLSIIATENIGAIQEFSAINTSNINENAFNFSAKNVEGVAKQFGVNAEIAAAIIHLGLFCVKSLHNTIFTQGVSVETIKSIAGPPISVSVKTIEDVIATYGYTIRPFYFGVRANAGFVVNSIKNIKIDSLLPIFSLLKYLSGDQFPILGENGVLFNGRYTIFADGTTEAFSDTLFVWKIETESSIFVLDGENNIFIIEQNDINWTIQQNSENFTLEPQYNTWKIKKG